MLFDIDDLRLTKLGNAPSEKCNQTVDLVDLLLPYDSGPFEGG